MKPVLKVALGAIALPFVVALGLRMHRLHEVLQAPIDIAPLLQALSAGRQPAQVSASLKQVCDKGSRCHCASAAVRAALDADLHALALGVLDAAASRCPEQPSWVGARAEALARSGAPDKAQDLATRALKADPKDPYGELALSRISYDKGRMTLTGDYAAKALQFGRGVEAERWSGRSALALGRFDEAQEHFKRLLEVNPNDTEATFTIAVCNEKLGHYMVAREGFLQTLHIDPKHYMSRYYLVLLTHGAGADDEARHHLQKLAEIAPPGWRPLSEVQALLAQTPDAGAPDGGVLAPINGRITVQGKR